MEELLSGANSEKGKLQRACLQLLREHEADGALPTSNRFLFYELLDRGVIEKVKRHPDGSPTKRRADQPVSEALKHLRDNSIVPWRWLVDETRNLDSWDYAFNVYQYVENVLQYARIDPWEREPPPLILCESRSLAGVLRDIASTYLCPIAATNGQVGGFLHTDLGPTIESMNGAVQRVFYFGDLDFSGGQIEANTRKVLSEYGDLSWERIAITEEQARERDLTAISKPDRRFKPPRYYDAIETEALRQVEIQRILTERLEGELPEPLEAVLAREEQQRVQVRYRLQG
jgi:hypothetical protein